MASTSAVPANHSLHDMMHDLMLKSDETEDDGISRELDLTEVGIIRKLRWHIDRIPILEKFRRSVDMAAMPTNREEYLRTKLHQAYPKLHATVLKNISAEGQKLVSPEKIKEIAEIFLQIAGGFHKKWFWTYDDRFNIRLTKFRNTPPTVSYPETFHLFPKLPSELRHMIWGFAVWTQDRFVDTYRLRRIKSAPCPALFLTCKEAKLHATKMYKRVRNGDLLYGKIMPASRKVRGPLISFENDIVMIGDWELWNSLGKPYPKEIVKLQAMGLPLRPIHKRIEKLSTWGFHRVLLERPHYVHPELLFYKNSRRHLTNFTKYGVRCDWGWTWTDNMEEVWTVDGVHNYIDDSVRKYIARVFPPVPGDDCICSLCERADLANGEPLLYQKPDPSDFEEHERIFETIDAGYYWGGNPMSMAQGLRLSNMQLL
ncbi:hypothetical protein F4813DRAFT_395695 [Daldinia decipiens]|uniref:uncharacterized protein n=1 Tax=Daldinia decipiens TaxID=326647 RepID=UPI0020C25430|nr:uncharacterized protein F4813DRAFT_395695 [Daldinia decipiens]KAI1658305.1 hypothetical protein F4813DRAFT_395695 [Daldinia decipiens]